MKKNPFHSLAVSAVNREHERHIQGPRDVRPSWPPRLKEVFAAIRNSLGSKPTLRVFRDPNPVYPFCK